MLVNSDMEDCAPGTSVPDFQSILWSASGTPIQFLAIFYYEERMKIQNPFFKKDLERERNPFKKDFPYDCFLFAVKQISQSAFGPLVRRIKNLEAGFGRHLRTFEATFGQKIQNTEAQE